MLQQQMVEAQTILSRAENMKAEAQMLGQKIKLETERQKQALQAEIDLLKLKVQQQEGEARMFKEGADLKFDYDKLATDTALKLTEMDATANRDLSQQMDENR